MATRRTTKRTTRPAADGECLCGCGAKTSSAKRQFAQGHDARLKSIGRQVAAGEMSASVLSAEARGWLRGHGIRINGRRRRA